MRIGLCILAGAALIAASILVVGRYEIGKVTNGASGFEVLGIDTWSGEAFAKSQLYEN